MQPLRPVGAAAAETGWSARMLRSLELHGLVTPRRTEAGYRLYGLAELKRLRTLRELRRRFGVELAELAFARPPRRGGPPPPTRARPARRRARAGPKGRVAARPALSAR